MTVLKLNKKKTILMIIDDQGHVFSTSLNFLMGLLNGKSPHGFVLCSRLPFDINDSRFKPSELYDPEGTFKSVSQETLTNNNDAISIKSREESKVKEGFKDKKVW